MHQARLARGLFAEQMNAQPPHAALEPTPVHTEPAPQPLDPERVRAAITIALDAALPAMIQEITERVLVALGH